MSLFTVAPHSDRLSLPKQSVKRSYRARNDCHFGLARQKIASLGKIVGVFSTPKSFEDKSLILVFLRSTNA
jgi:hypothetical protein